MQRGIDTNLNLDFNPILKKLNENESLIEILIIFVILHMHTHTDTV